MGSVAIAGIRILTFGNPLGTILYVLGGVSPAICEIFLKKYSSSKEEFQCFMKSIVNPKHSIWMYLYAIGGAMVIQAIWHLPLWFIDGTYQQTMNFMWFCIN